MNITGRLGDRARSGRLPTMTETTTIVITTVMIAVMRQQHVASMSMVKIAIGSAMKLDKVVGRWNASTSSVATG